MEMESPKRSGSPEFEFWMVGNSHPELEPSGLLTADELFVDGVLLPLHLLSILPPDPNTKSKSAHLSEFGSGTPEPPTKKYQNQEEESSSLEAAPAASICQPTSICSSSPASLTSSKRWKDIFKVGEKKKESSDEKEKKERKSSNGSGGGNGSAGAAELNININIWPFSRSRSAGTASGARPKAATAMRKSSSAPCSRSNSRGENSVGRRWAASPGRPGVGVHVGRASPVWQVRRTGKGAEAGAGRATKGSRPKGGNRGLGLNVNSCIGYRNQVSCRGEDCDGERAAANNANGSLFKFRSLFSKKVF